MHTEEHNQSTCNGGNITSMGILDFAYFHVMGVLNIDNTKIVCQKQIQDC